VPRTRTTARRVRGPGIVSRDPRTVTRGRSLSGILAPHSRLWSVGRSARRWGEIAAFLAPAAALFVVFVLVPLGAAVYYSGFRWDGLSPLTDWVGLGNYERALGDAFFVGAIGHNLFILVLSLAVQQPVALALALALSRDFRGRTTFRLVFFAPYVISEATIGVVWYLILQPAGPFDQTLRAAGLGFLEQLWLADRDLVLTTLFVVISWQYFGFSMILYLAGLTQIPRELVEAAAIDGATGRAMLRHITLPLLGPTIRVAFFLSAIGSLQVFGLVFIMTGGGPFHASDTMVTWMIEQGFSRTSLGYGAAMAVILGMIGLVFSLFYQRFVLRRDIEGAVTSFAG
jgi:raffinose/stachyose/melibiose transport system permease protein